MVPVISARILWKNYSLFPLEIIFNQPVSFSLLDSLQNIPGFLQFLALGVHDGLVDPLVGEPHQGLHVFGRLGKFETIDEGKMRVSSKPGVDLNA